MTAGQAAVSLAAKICDRLSPKNKWLLLEKMSATYYSFLPLSYPK
jgi:hypothetical protein